MATSRFKVPPPEEPPMEELPADSFAEPQGWTDKLVSVTPWWLISILLHSAAFVVCAFVIVMAAPTESTEVIQAMAPPPPPPMPEVEKPKDLDPAKKFLEDQKSVEDPIFKRAEESDHNETADEEDFQSNKGENLDFVSDKPFKGFGVNDAIGVGGGGGGAYGGRKGGRKNLVARGGGSDRTENAVLMALRWLARHQNEDGSWSMKDYVQRCGKIKPEEYKGQCEGHGIHASVDVNHHNYEVGLTGLSMLAFLGAGYTHTSPDKYDGIKFGDVVRKGLQYIVSKQDNEGCIGSRETSQHMYNHTIAALALSEAYGCSGSPRFREPAQRSVDFTVAAQNQPPESPLKGWRYRYRAGDNDSSVTGWAVMVLKSAELSGLNFDRKAYDGARSWFDEVTYQAGGGTGGDTKWKAGYQFGGDADVAIPGINDQFSQHPSMTAIMAMCRIFMDKKQGDAKVRGACMVLLDDLPVWEDLKIDFYYWYYASLALYQYDGPEGSVWKSWNKHMVDSLVNHQNDKSTGCKVGSWEPVCRWACKGGRVYCTAINALTLEVYYRYASVFGSKK